MGTIKIGQEIESYCGKCKSDRIHVITTIADEKMDKLMCKTCEAYHRYRKPKGETADTAGATTSKETQEKPVKRRTRRDKWTRLLEETQSESASDYVMETNYEVATAINHKTFGLGVVKNIIDSRKIEVLFHDGAKILVQNLIR
ncbi:hypothetical protein H8E88_09040 [candidate division KSB1 bacterium]|nr:hypothetical protein [candidate division KSB1 bacterium]MBL7092367.1 hypothetical protein [candidate division KSB1 bacterium]